MGKQVNRPGKIYRGTAGMELPKALESVNPRVLALAAHESYPGEIAERDAVLLRKMSFADGGCLFEAPLRHEEIASKYLV